MSANKDLIIIKATSGGAFRKVKVSASRPSWLDFSSRISQLFDRMPPIVVYHYDDDGDLVMVDSEDEFITMIEGAIAHGNKIRVGVGDPSEATDAALRNLSGNSTIISRASSIIEDVSMAQSGPATGNLIGNITTQATRAPPAVPAQETHNSDSEGWERVDKTPATEYPLPPAVPNEPATTGHRVTVAPASPEVHPQEPLPKYSELDGNSTPSAPPAQASDVTHSSGSEPAMEDVKKAPEATSNSAAQDQASSSQPSNFQNVQEAIEQLIRTIRGVLEQHPELYEQATTVMNHVIDAMTHGSHQLMHAFEEWHRAFTSNQEGNNSGNQEGPQEGTPWRRGRQFGCRRGRGPGTYSGPWGTWGQQRGFGGCRPRSFAARAFENANSAPPQPPHPWWGPWAWAGRHATPGQDGNDRSMPNPSVPGGFPPAAAEPSPTPNMTDEKVDAMATQILESLKSMGYKEGSDFVTSHVKELVKAYGDANRVVEILTRPGPF